MATNRTRHWMLDFGPTLLAAGEVRQATTTAGCTFRGEKLILGASGDVGGTFRVSPPKGPERTFADDQVLAYSNVKKKRTTFKPVGVHRSLACEAQSVVYAAIDPLTLIAVQQIHCGTSGMLPVGGSPLPGSFFATGAMGNATRFPTAPAAVAIVLTLKNNGNVPVTVYATIFGLAVV